MYANIVSRHVKQQQKTSYIDERLTKMNFALTTITTTTPHK